MSAWQDFAAEIKIMQDRIGFDAARERILRGLLSMGKEGGATFRDYDDLISPELAKTLKQVQADYDKVVSLANDVYSELGKDVTRDLEKIQSIEQVQLREWGKQEAEILDKVEYRMRKAAVRGVDSKTLKKYLEPIGGSIQSHAETLAKHFVKTHGQVCKVEKADSAGVIWYAFVGPPTVANSHVFCLQMTATRWRTFSRDDIAQMSNGQRDPVLFNRGGYRCRHDWDPRPSFKPPEGKTVEFVTVPTGSRDVKIGSWA